VSVTVNASHMDLGRFVADFAKALERADARSPVAVNQRSKQTFLPGIGPHPEAASMALVMKEMAQVDPDRYVRFQSSVAYPDAPRRKCDLCLGLAPDWEWAIEAKLLRLLGDNGQPNDNLLMHILSPYPEHRSALTDCEKLLGSGLGARKAVMIFGYDSDDWPLSLAIDAFEVLARSRVVLGERKEAAFTGLVHPVHRSGRVFAWELIERR
jgi:hypothetical protein